MTDYTILHAPRIRLATFAAVLTRAGSPARSAAADVYAGAVAHGVDPAILLAVFLHESGYGTAGVARHTRSWGNLRRSPTYPTPDHCGFAHYPTFEAGGIDTARLLRVYGKNAIRPGRDTSTARTFPYVWAPSADGNRPEAYGAAIVRAVDSYRALDRRLAATPTSSTHVTPYAGTRLRVKASTAASIVDELRAGTTARVAASVAGATYRLPDGRRGSTWVKITAVGGRPLPSPVYSAALLWRPL